MGRFIAKSLLPLILLSASLSPLAVVGTQPASAVTLGNAMKGFAAGVAVLFLVGKGCSVIVAPPAPNCPANRTLDDALREGGPQTELVVEGNGNWGLNFDASLVKDGCSVARIYTPFPQMPLQDNMEVFDGNGNLIANSALLQVAFPKKYQFTDANGQEIAVMEEQVLQSLVKAYTTWNVYQHGKLVAHSTRLTVNSDTVIIVFRDPNTGEELARLEKTTLFNMFNGKWKLRDIAEGRYFIYFTPKGKEVLDMRIVTLVAGNQLHSDDYSSSDSDSDSSSSSGSNSRSRSRK